MEKVSQNVLDKQVGQNIVFDLTKNPKLKPEASKGANFKDYINTRAINKPNAPKYVPKETVRTQQKPEKTGDATKTESTANTDPKKSIYDEKTKPEDSTKTQKSEDEVKESVQKKSDGSKDEVESGRKPDKSSAASNGEKTDKKDTVDVEDDEVDELSKEAAAVLNVVSLLADAVKDVQEMKPEDMQDLTADIQKAFAPIMPEHLDKLTKDMNLTDDMKKALDMLAQLAADTDEGIEDNLSKLMSEDMAEPLQRLQDFLLNKTDEGSLLSKIVKNMEVLEKPEQPPMDFASELQNLRVDINNQASNMSGQFADQMSRELNIFDKDADINQADSFYNDIKVIGFTDRTATQVKMMNTNMAEQIQNFNRIIDEIRIAFNNNKTSISLKLEPENLGKLNVKINSENGILNASFFVESEKAKQILENQMVTLRQALTDQGITVQDINVQVGQNNEDLTFHKNMMEAKNYSQKLGKVITEEETQGFNPYIKDDDLFNDLI